MDDKIKDALKDLSNITADNEFKSRMKMTMREEIDLQNQRNQKKSFIHNRLCQSMVFVTAAVCMIVITFMMSKADRGQTDREEGLLQSTENEEDTGTDIVADALKDWELPVSVNDMPETDFGIQDEVFDIFDGNYSYGWVADYDTRYYPFSFELSISEDGMIYLRVKKYMDYDIILTDQMKLVWEDKNGNVYEDDIVAGLFAMTPNMKKVVTKYLYELDQYDKPRELDLVKECGLDYTLKETQGEKYQTNYYQKIADQSIKMYLVTDLIITDGTSKQKVTVKVRVAYRDGKYVPSEKYSQEEIQAAVDTITTEFESNWNGCTMKEIYYPGDQYSELFEDWANRNDADDVIVLLSTFDVDETGGNGSLNPDCTYEDWNWILVRKSGQEWQHVDHGY